MKRLRSILIGLSGFLPLLISLSALRCYSTEPDEKSWEKLPEPSRAGKISLEEALARRRSIRRFGKGDLTKKEISQILWAAQGLTSPRGFRTAPSAGALYPLEVYMLTREGVFHYSPRHHGLRKIKPGDHRPALARAALGQRPVRDAAADFVIAAVYARTARKYGARAERYVKIEAGHCCQNILLQATALQLGSVPIGAFYDGKVQAALSLPEDHEPLYIVPVGRP